MWEKDASLERSVEMSKYSQGNVKRKRTNTTETGKTQN